jgi:signal transduction histidine kinase
MSALDTPLLWRVIPWLFLSVILVQLFALYPIVRSYRQTLYEYRAKTLHARVETLARLHSADPAVLDRTLASSVQGGVLGLALFENDGRVLSAHGRPSPLGSGFVPQEASTEKVAKNVLLVTWVGEVEGRTYRAVATLDISEEAQSVREFVMATGLLSVPAALLATLAGALTLVVGVLAPIRRLRDELMSRASTHLRPGDVERESLDELEQVRVFVERLDEARALAREAEQHAHDASRAKDEFLANMSHELRTPLSSIISYTQILLAMGAVSRDEVRSDLEKIATSAQHVSDLVGNILTFSKLEAGKMPVDAEDFDVGELVGQAVDMVEPFAKQNENRVVIELPAEPITMHSDPVKVRQSLLNVLGNACKFTSKGNVIIKVSLATGEGSELVRFAVEDTGIGMSDEELGRVFEPFEQADTGTTKRYGGTGLGLSITRRFCAMLGGRVEAKSAPGRGSVFTITLPRTLSD